MTDRNDIFGTVAALGAGLCLLGAAVYVIGNIGAENADTLLQRLPLVQSVGKLPRASKLNTDKVSRPRYRIDGESMWTALAIPRIHAKLGINDGIHFQNVW